MIERGLVKLCRQEGDREVIVGLRSTGWWLGAAAVILEKPYPATAETLSRCDLRRIGARDFRRLLKTNSELAWHVLRELSREVHDHTIGRSGLASSRARLRVERFLSELCRKQSVAEPPANFRLQWPAKQWEIAQLIAVSPQDLSRVLKDNEKGRNSSARKGLDRPIRPAKAAAFR